jgi:hypothetical protein
MVDAELEVLTEILVRKLEEFLIRFDLSNQLSFQAAAIQNKKTDSEFTLFPKMPVELQEMVWKKALPGTYRGCTFFSCLGMALLIPLKTLSSFIFSSDICSRDMSRGATSPINSQKK